MGIPVRVFLFTLDQVATMVNVTLQQFKLKYVHYAGRSTGVKPPDRMLARNIAPDGERPEWRIAERELIRWCKTKGFKLYERGWPVV